MGYLVLVLFLTGWRYLCCSSVHRARTESWMLQCILLKDMFEACRLWKMCKLVCRSLLNWFHVIGKCIKGVHCARQSVEYVSWCATCYRKRQCRSFKVTVLLPYQVPPDVIVSSTPHAVVVYYYHNGWLRDYHHSHTAYKISLSWSSFVSRF